MTSNDMTSDTTSNDTTRSDVTGESRRDLPEATPVDEATPRGPAIGTALFGFLLLVLAGGVVALEALDLDVDWVGVGPWAVVAGGVVIVVFGAIGLLASRRD
ncbi:hypothetical protein [Janibacter sp. G56]|uniref:hypothetical protein n=1 Tax=Janibacter sp. G56 TaxID=3418717 RepID=UPI003D01EDD3